jgi:DNA polymerase-3 subunit gamma/tau
VEISDRTLERIARAGEGSVRDSLSVLERVLAFCGDHVRDEDALQVLGVVRSEVLVEMIRSLSDRDAAGMLKVLDGLVDEGHDLVHFWSEWVGVLRDLLMLRVLPDGAELLARAPEEIEALAEAAGALTREDLLRAFQILADLERDLKSSSQPRFLFEAMLIRLANLGAVRPIEDVLASLQSSGGGGGPPPGGPTGGPARSGKGRRQQGKKPATRRTASEAGPESAFLASVHDAKPMLGAMLEEAASVSVETGRLVIRLEETTGALRKRLEERDSVDVLNRCAIDALGTPTKVVIQRTGHSDGAVASDREQRRGRAGAPANRGARPARPEWRGDLLETAKKEPGVEKLLHELGAQVVDIRPLEAPRNLVAAEAEEKPREEER